MALISAVGVELGCVASLTVVFAVCRRMVVQIFTHIRVLDDVVGGLIVTGANWFSPSMVVRSWLKYKRGV